MVGLPGMAFAPNPPDAPKDAQQISWAALANTPANMATVRMLEMRVQELERKLDTK